MRYILNPRFDISLRNIEPSHKILNPGFNISWPLYIEHPFDFHLLLERGGSKYHGRDISTPPSFTNSNWRRGSKYYVLIYRTPPLIIIAIVEGVQNIMAVIIEPPSISNWKGGSKYHGHDTMTHCYRTQEVKKRL